MSASIVTAANLGTKTNLKTPDILPIIEKFVDKGEMTQVICNINTDFHFPNTYSAIPLLLRYPLRAIEKLFGLPFKQTYRTLTDFFVSLRLQATDVVFFHPPTRFKRTLRKAKRNGSITVAITTVAHPRFDQKISTEEHQRFGSSFNAEQFEEASTFVEEFDYIIAISDHIKSSYVEQGFPKDRIFVAHNDIVLPLTYERKNTGDKFKVLYVAYTKMRKGLPYLLEAWKKLKTPNTELVLVSKYSADVTEKFKEYCDNIIKNDKSITWAGTTDDLAPYYSEASAFVLPSLTEGNPRVVMQAMAHGLPVITTSNAQSLVEDGKSGFVVPIRDVRALEEKIRYLYENQNVAERMGVEARKTMEHKKPFGEIVFEIYQEIIKRKKNHR